MPREADASPVRCGAAAAPRRSIARGALSREEMSMLMLKRFVVEETGQDLIEYGLLIGIITVACVASIIVLGPLIAGYYSALIDLLP